MTPTFKAGETYQTYDGRSATLVGKVHGWFIGYIWENGPIPTRWFESGSHEDSGKSLQPPKRQVWVAVWRATYGSFVGSDVAHSEIQAEQLACTRIRTRIAVLGPFDAEAEP